ncbi:putative Uncharacterized membrane protein YabM [[Clostridium] ultunense Esp]|nr:putative Uncharacterized membrane protein YabM [[Clostridium] ultunense Esp]
MTKKHFLHGALLLSIAALVSKILSMFYRIPLQQMTGDTGLAMYTAAYPIYTTIVILVVSGIPIVLSKMISEHLAGGTYLEIRRILLLSFIFLNSVGFVSFLILFLGADQIARMVGWGELATSIRAVSFALLFVPTLAILRGYFYGYQDQAPPANSQILEQLFRVLTIVFLAYFLVKAGFPLHVVISGATFGTVVGVFASFLYLLISARRFKAKETFLKHREGRSTSLSNGHLFRQIVFYTIAVSLSALMVPLLGLADSFTGIKLLQWATGSLEQAKEAFGVYSRGLPFVQFTTIFANSLGLSLIPRLAEADQTKNHKDVVYASSLALKITVLFGLPAAAGLALLSENINIFFFGDSDGSFSMSLLSFTSFFLTMAITIVSILQGVGKIYLPALLLGIIFFIKILLNYWLIPLYQINGAALATFFSYMLLFVLNAILLQRFLGRDFSWGSLLFRPALATAGMAAALLMLEEGFALGLLPHFSRLEAAIRLLLLIPIGSVVYGILLLLLKGVERRELERIPKIGNLLVFWLTRLRLMGK